MKIRKRSISIVLSVAIIGTIFTGCEQADGLLEKTASYVVSDETISKDSKWINSDVEGIVTEDTSVSEKDDFATASNKEWILSVADRVKKEQNVSCVEDNYKVIAQQKQALLNTAIAGGNFEENKVGMDKADYDHVSDVFTKVVSAAADWDARNEADVEPLEKYISAIESIDTLDKMTNYLCDENGEFFSKDYLIPFGVTSSLDEKEDEYDVSISSTFADSLDTEDNGDLREAYVMETVKEILGKLGYSSSEATKIVKQCWQLETTLSEHTSYIKIMSKNPSVDEIKKQFNHTYTADELVELAGNYPMMDILKTYNYDQSQKYIVYEPDYVKAVARLYKEKNLEKIKAYYIVHTILDAMPLLSRDYYDQYEKYFTNISDSEDEEETEDKKEEESLDELSKEDQILQNFVMSYINGIFEEMYVTNYCSSEQKEYIQNLIQDAITEYEKILASEDWMSETTKQKAIEKLNCITTRALYPDELDNYEDLQLDESNLVDVVAKINAYTLRKDAKKINTKINKKGWDVESMPFTAVNAYYSPQDNSVTILAGIVASKELLDMNASDEENMGHLGYIIGHEISHAFDTTGYLYDKDGKEEKWWTDKDEEAFQKRVAKLVKYYSSFKSFRNSPSNINGEQIQGEAIADMGGLKCMIEISKHKENFDYQKFFRAFAGTWATCNSYRMELNRESQDEHPLPFLRTNVTVQQFEEFYEAFDIQPGDGMYLAPEKRIAVW